MYLFCPNCGNNLAPGTKFCPNCGCSISENVPNNKRMFFIGLVGGLGVLLIIFGIIWFKQNSKYYFSSDSYDNSGEIATTTSPTNKSKYSTAIIADNVYYGVQINSSKNADDLIIKDSISQKDKCPNEIQKIENDIIKEFDIKAVNLCEINIDFAKGIENVIKTIYEKYPSVRGYLTNITITNTTMNENYIAAFMPTFPFAEGDTNSKYKNVMKTQILLNSAYFLNTERMQANVDASSKEGWFPKNTTIYSPVAHELGHYLSYLAMMKSHNLKSVYLIDESNINDLYSIAYDFNKGDHSLAMIKEAYEKYKQEVGTDLEFDAWRRTISQYAVAKDNEGNYIYDETIAEAFHDVYLNDTKAADASKYVVDVLIERLGA